MLLGTFHKWHLMSYSFFDFLTPLSSLCHAFYILMSGIFLIFWHITHSYSSLTFTIICPIFNLIALIDYYGKNDLTSIVCLDMVFQMQGEPTEFLITLYTLMCVYILYVHISCRNTAPTFVHRYIHQASMAYETGNTINYPISLQNGVHPAI